MLDLTKLLSTVFGSLLQVSPARIPFAYIAAFASLVLVIALALPVGQDRWFLASTPLYCVWAVCCYFGVFSDRSTTSDSREDQLLTSCVIGGCNAVLCLVVIARATASSTPEMILCYVTSLVQLGVFAFYLPRSKRVSSSNGDRTLNLVQLSALSATFLFNAALGVAVASQVERTSLFWRDVIWLSLPLWAFCTASVVVALRVILAPGDTAPLRLRLGKASYSRHLILLVLVALGFGPWRPLRTRFDEHASAAEEKSRFDVVPHVITSNVLLSAEGFCTGEVATNVSVDSLYYVVEWVDAAGRVVASDRDYMGLLTPGRYRFSHFEELGGKATSCRARIDEIKL